MTFGGREIPHDSDLNIVSKITTDEICQFCKGNFAITEYECFTQGDYIGQLWQYYCDKCKYQGKQKIQFLGEEPLE